ncbi:SpoIIE family protein phosphatase [Cytophagales bacterium LB-30]|uniref:SpoIIE family protein phosphatase n=1 Tax=Shiella aurantiaca TaxID=3058365 RepID=A0ABT8F9F9_9BACT|nr:SpoIIE family protein phosphatase [Shiella aurantiaca]MDN4167030.1 SpoIIE family protein phosphatase [Shiella aurantiaca]
MVRYLFLSIGLLISLAANAQEYDIAHVFSGQLQASHSVRAIAIDKKGYVWVGTEKGLFRYDSRMAERVIYEQDAFTQVRGLVTDPEQGVYATTDQGLYHIYSLTDVRPIVQAPIIHSVFSSQDLYALTDTAALKINADKILRSLPFSQEGLSKVEVVNDQVWLAGLSGLFQWNSDDNTLKQRISEPILDLMEFNDNLYFLSANSLKSISNDRVLPVVSWADFQATCFTIEPSGIFAFGTTSQGLMLYNGFSFKPLNTESGLKVQSVSELVVDAEGMLWLAGKGAFAGIQLNQPMQEVKLPISASEVIDVIESKRQYPMLLLKTHLLEIKGDGSFVWHSLPQGVQGAQLKNDAKGNIHVMSNEQELWRFDEEKFQKIKTFEQAIVPDFVDKIPQTLLSQEGAYYHIDTTGNVRLEANFRIKPAKGNIQKAAIEKESLVWLDATHTLWQTDLRGISTQRATLVHDFAFVKGRLVVLKEHSPSMFGLYALQATSDSLVRIIDAEQTPLLPQLFVDKQENLWVGEANTLQKWTVSFTDSTYSLDNQIRYGKEQGLEDSHILFAHEFQQGQIWFKTVNSLLQYDPLKELPSLKAPLLVLDKVIVQSGKGERLVQKSQHQSVIDLAYDEVVKIQWYPVEFFSSQSIASVSYRINEKEWKSTLSDNELILSSLPSGFQSVEVKAISSSGIESTQMLVLNFSVSTPYWQQLWFLLASGGGILLVGFVAYRTLLNVRDSKSKELQGKLGKELEEVERKSHQQILKAEKLKQLNELIRSQKEELENKNKQIEGQKYELAVTNEQIKKQKDLILETGNKLKASINYAQRIQDALMSNEVEIKQAIDDSFVLFQPRDVVSGDFFWFKKMLDANTGNELLMLAAVDCTGHGVPGAIMSVVGMNLLNTNASIKGLTDPGEILINLNIDLKDQLSNERNNVNDGMDMAIVVIDKANRVLKYAGAKNPLYYMKDGQMEIIKADKNPIGGQQSEEMRLYETHVIPFQDEPSMYYIFSDGYQDQFGGEKGYKFLSKNFRELLINISDKPVLDQKEILSNTINEWKGKLAQTDDILVIGFRI